MRVTLSELESKYWQDLDPWNFRTSPYEQEKFTATRQSLSRKTYQSVLELGCGNGALAEHLAPMCQAYIGVDAVERALTVARQMVPEASFINAFFPCTLPEGPHDLIVLSEVLYFLDTTDIKALAQQIVDNWSAAEIVCVTYLGETSHELQGDQSLEAFKSALGPSFNLVNVRCTQGYRIDSHVPLERAQ